MLTKEESTIIKGSAIWMMMLHHCFLAGRYEKYGISFWPFAESQIVNIANFFKICVSLFAFVSGYGLYLSYTSYITSLHADHNKLSACNGQWIIRRLVKTLSGYWFVVVMSWIFCVIVDQLPLRAYAFEKSTIYGLWNMGLDFLGLSNFFSANPMNGTWWYMSAAISYIVLTPLFISSIQKVGCIVTIGLLFIFPRICTGYPGGTHFMSFLPAFIFGIISAHSKAFEKWKIWQNNHNHIPMFQIGKFIFMLLLLVISYKLYYRLPTDKYWDIKWGLIPIVVILFITDYIAIIPGIKQLLLFCGKHSMNIFLTHTFIRYYYCEQFTYSMHHFLLVIAVLLGLSLIISIGIEYLKKALHYESLFTRLGNRNV